MPEVIKVICVSHELGENNMSKMKTEPKTHSFLAAEQFIELCRENKHHEISVFLKKTTQDNINAIIHAIEVMKRFMMLLGMAV